MSIVSGYVTNVQMSKKGRVKMLNVKVWQAEVASPSDVSPNTPKADEANLYFSFTLFINSL